MKKILASTLTAALVAGAAATACATGNPFSDVPAGHWAYDAIQQLAADGIIEGYGDSTYRGDRNITRFEMAQLVARATTKNATGADKALLDKLSAEFADELKTLGVRIAELEKHADNVKFGGELRYRYLSRREYEQESSERKNYQYVTLRLEPEMRVNDHWTAHARIDYHFDMKAAQNGVMTNSEGGPMEEILPGTRVERIWVQGDYKNFQVLLGKLPYKTFVDEGLLMDYSVSGGQVTFGNKVKSTLTIARANQQYQLPEKADTGTYEQPYNAADYQGIEIYNDRDAKFTWGVGYHHFHNRSTTNDKNTMTALGTSHMNIWTLGLGWRFDKNWRLHGAAAWNTSGKNQLEATDPGATEPSGQLPSRNPRLAWSMQLDYKGANPANQGSWGAYAAYRRLGLWATWIPTYEINGAVEQNNRGWDFGVSYVPLKNVSLSAKYFRGSGIDEYEKINALFGEIEMFF